jgi:antirestriction protein
MTQCCYSSSYDLFDLNRYIELRDAVNQLGFDRAAVAAFIGWYGSWDTDAFESAYMGHHDSERSYAEQYIDETGMLDEMPESLQCYFDYEAFARDLFMGDYYFDDGFVFCCNC